MVQAKMDEARKQQFQGQWEQLRGQIKQKYGQVTDDDLRKTEGRYDRVVGTIREKTGKQNQEIERDLDNILGSRTK